MRRSGSIATLLTLMVLCGAPAHAQEVTLRLSNDTEYNSNFLGRSEDEIYAVRNLIGPGVTIADPYGRFTYSLDYLGQYSWYIEPWEPDINAWEQSVIGTMSYAFDRRTQLTISESFRDLSNVRFGFDAQDDLSDTLNTGLNRFKRNSFGFQLEHSFSRRLVGSLLGQHDWIDFERNVNQSDSQSAGAQGQMLYAVTRSDRVGGGVGFVYQSFDGELNSPSSTGKIYSGSIDWEHRFDDDFRVSFSGGPTYIQTASSTDFFAINYPAQPDATATGIEYLLFDATCDPDLDGIGLESACQNFSVSNPPNAPGLAVVSLPIPGGGDSSDDVTFFGSVNVVKRWIDWELSARYRRTQSAGAGDGGTSTLDRILVRVRYDPNRTWEIYSSVGWNRRQRVSAPIVADDFVVVDDGDGFAQRATIVAGRGGDRSQDVQQVSFILGATRSFSRQLRARFDFRYRYQTRKRTVGADTRADFFVVNARIDYDLAPIRF